MQAGSKGYPMRRERSGFTLIELLVVVSIIAMLMSILLPAFSKFRVASKRAVCMANLHSLSQMLQAYLNENHDHWPYASHMISVETDPNRRALPDVLMGGIRGAREVFLCPADEVTEEPNWVGDTYFEHEQTSYEWDILGVFNGVKKGKGLLRLIKSANPGEVPLLNDWECFHGGQGKAQSIVILYADLSVSADDSPVDPQKWLAP